MLRGQIGDLEIEDESHYLQSVPVKIKNQETCQGNVKPYFTNFIKDEGGELTNVLRGRPLNGKVTELEDFKIAVMKVPSHSQVGDESEEVTCRTASVCKKMTVWNYDLPHGQGNDVLSKGLFYAQMSKIIHS